MKERKIDNFDIKIKKAGFLIIVNLEEKMERNEVLEKVIKLTKEKLVVKKNIEVTENTRFQEDLNADSIDITDFVMELENVFDIKISDKDMENIQSVRDAVDLIYLKKSK